MITTATNDFCYEFRGLSTDTKPTDTNVGNGSVFIEMDSGKVFFFDKEHTTWILYTGTFAIR